MNPGDRCIITRDIVVSDRLAFISGEPVIVEKVAPSPQRPESKYVVLSAAVQQRFLLTEADLQLAAAPRPVEVIPAGPTVPAGSPGDVFAGQALEGVQENVFVDRISPPETASGFRSSRAFLPVVVGACLAVITAIIAAITMLGGGAKAPAGIPSDWKVYSGKGVQMWLPQVFMVGRTTGDLNRITSQLKEPANAYDQISQAMKRDSSAIVLFALNRGLQSSGKMSSLCVTAQVMPEGMGFSDLMDAGVADTTPSLTLLYKQIVTIGGHKMAQMEYEGNIGSDQVAQVAFIVSGGETVYLATFQCPAQDLDQELPYFSKIIGSIKSS